jgi:hypothetical protein
MRCIYCGSEEHLSSACPKKDEDNWDEFGFDEEDNDPVNDDDDL